MSLCKVVLDPRIFRPANDQRDHNKHDKGGSTNKILQERASSMCMNRIVLKYGITVTKQHRKGEGGVQALKIKKMYFFKKICIPVMMKLNDNVK